MESYIYLMEIENILIKILNIQKPWNLQRVEVLHQVDVVRIDMDYLRDSTFKCPKCGIESKVHDGSYREWRHLDFLQYKTYLRIKVPRVNCNDCGVLTINEMPFGRMGSHYSFFLND